MTETATLPSKPLGDAIAGAVDSSVNRRLGPIRRAIKALLETERGLTKEVGDIRKEVDTLKERPQIDPVALLTEAVGSATRKLDELDAKAVEEIEQEINVPTGGTSEAR